MNNCSIPSTHTKRKIIVCSHRHSFTPYPSLSPYRQTELQTEKRNSHCAWAGGTFFPVVMSCQFFGFWREIGFGVTTYVSSIQYSFGIVLVFWFWREKFLVLHMYLVYNTVVRLCQFFGCGGK